MARSSWKQADPLFRGDDAAGPTAPDPRAQSSVVAHILYLGGSGRPTPYSSATESEEVAEHFARPRGAVFETSVPRAKGVGAGHMSRDQLRQDLRGFGKGQAKWDDATEVAMARAYVELWSEHLLDWRRVDPARVAGAVRAAFTKKGR